MLDIGILHLHKTAVFLFLIITIIQLFPLLINKKNLFITIKGKTKIIKIIIDTLLLFTGIYLLWKSPLGLTLPYIVKITAILIMILTISIGIKKYNTLFILAGLVVWLYIYQLSITHRIDLKPLNKQVENISDGKTLYNALCAKCHGYNADKSFLGAVILKKSTLPENQIKKVIKNGRNTMPSFQFLTDEQVNEITKYIQQLKNK